MKYLILFSLIAIQTNVTMAQNRYDIVIDEIMADPSPAVGLPNNEWIELRNTSRSAISLQDWRIGDPGDQTGPMPGFILQPDSFLIVCASSALSNLSTFGTAISVTNFPSLDNEDDLLYLKAPNGNIIHAVHYSSSWYRNELKKNGGWSLEMIDPFNPCIGSDNWKASNNTAGGTPGRINSSNGIFTATNGPELKRTYTINDTTVILVFNEPLDGISGATVSNYTISGGLNIVQAEPLPPLFDQVALTLSSPMQTSIVYNITVSAIMDCKSNMITTHNNARAGKPLEAEKEDIIINEILFNPRPGGYDYIELYNKSGHILDASKLYLANRNASNIISSITQLTTASLYIFPGDYLLLTEYAASLERNYFVKDPDAVLILASFPSFPDDKGTVVLLDDQGEPIDEVAYDDDWHFKLIADAEGVSLEKIDPAAIAQDAANWHSAASTVGFGTPTYRNSQFRNAQVSIATIMIDPSPFSPDNDGYNDIATIHYNVEQPGYVANIIIFDAAGRPVRNLVRNQLMGNKGYWHWDGLNDNGGKLSPGIYIILTEIFNLQGKKQQFKNIIVLAIHK